MRSLDLFLYLSSYNRSRRNLFFIYFITRSRLLYFLSNSFNHILILLILPQSPSAPSVVFEIPLYSSLLLRAYGPLIVTLRSLIVGDFLSLKRKKVHKERNIAVKYRLLYSGEEPPLGGVLSLILVTIFKGYELSS